MAGRWSALGTLWIGCLLSRAADGTRSGSAENDQNQLLPTPTRTRRITTRSAPRDGSAPHASGAWRRSNSWKRLAAAHPAAARHHPHEFSGRGGGRPLGVLEVRRGSRRRLYGGRSHIRSKSLRPLVSRNRSHRPPPSALHTRDRGARRLERAPPHRSSPLRATVPMAVRESSPRPAYETRTAQGRDTSSPATRRFANRAGRGRIPPGALVPVGDHFEAIPCLSSYPPLTQAAGSSILANATSSSSTAREESESATSPTSPSASQALGIERRSNV
jgi:hypothetical protein